MLLPYVESTVGCGEQRSCPALALGLWAIPRQVADPEEGGGGRERKAHPGQLAAALRTERVCARHRPLIASVKLKC